jgi:hypothetical protein
MSRALVKAFRMCSRKVRYATHAAATGDQPGMRHYHCPICGGWHASSPAWTKLRAYKRLKRRIQDRIFANPIPLPLTHGAAGDPRTGASCSA